MIQLLGQRVGAVTFVCHGGRHSKLLSGQDGWCPYLSGLGCQIGKARTSTSPTEGPLRSRQGLAVGQY